MKSGGTCSNDCALKGYGRHVHVYKAWVLKLRVTTPPPLMRISELSRIVAAAAETFPDFLMTAEERF
jgi:hypothetical protein